jgi:hypothetical protein
MVLGCPLFQFGLAYDSSQIRFLSCSITGQYLRAQGTGSALPCRMSALPKSEMKKIPPFLGSNVLPASIQII